MVWCCKKQVLGHLTNSLIEYSRAHGRRKGQSTFIIREKNNPEHDLSISRMPSNLVRLNTKNNSVWFRHMWHWQAYTIIAKLQKVSGRKGLISINLSQTRKTRKKWSSASNTPLCPAFWYVSSLISSLRINYLSQITFTEKEKIITYVVKE